jgi:hypothetical protein
VILPYDVVALRLGGEPGDETLLGVSVTTLLMWLCN